MKRALLFLLGIIVGIIGVTYLISQPKVDATNRTHTALYEGAEGTWNAQPSVSAFNEQEVNGELVGSSSYLSLDWHAPDQDFNHYVVTVTHAQDGTVRSEASEKMRPRLDLSDLNAGERYIFAVQACLDPRCEQWLMAETEPSGVVPEEVWSQTNGEQTDSEGEQTLLNP